MINKDESAMKANVEQINQEFSRAAPFIGGLNEWIEWRTEKLQGMRQEIAEKTRLTGKPDPVNLGRAAGRG